MANTPEKLVVAISSRALFDLDSGHDVYEKEGVDAYRDYQISHENTPLEPGEAFYLVQKLLRLNEFQPDLVEIILLSRNSTDTGLRIFNSIAHHDLAITRAAFTSGASPYRYVSAFGAHLFLSAHAKDVCRALFSGCAAATIMSQKHPVNADEQLRIAFDGDAVLFSDEAEKIYQNLGLPAFAESEQASAHEPLSNGPFKNFLTALHRIQSVFDTAEPCPIRTALVTARGAPAHERVMRTLRSWGIRIDEALFLGGMDKGEFLQAFNADFYFDDQQCHLESTGQHVASAHVPYGVINN